MNKMDKIKCPKCGSTAQPKISTLPSVYEKGNLIVTTHKCGCGCVFQRHYTIIEVKIMDDEDE